MAAKRWSATASQERRASRMGSAATAIFRIFYSSAAAPVTKQKPRHIAVTKYACLRRVMADLCVACGPAWIIGC